MITSAKPTIFYRMLPVILLVLFAAVALQKPRLVGIDYFPLDWGAEKLMLHQSPYGEQATAALASIWPAQFNVSGMAYPLPALLPAVPLAFLPYPMAAAIWIIASIFLICMSPLPIQWPELRLFPLIFFPLTGTLVGGQATAFWLGLIVLMLNAMHRGWRWPIGLCIALLPAKPQVGMLFALYGVIWAWKNDRRVLAWAMGFALAMWGGVTALQPNWIGEWTSQLQLYQDIVKPHSILILTLPLVITTWHMGWVARITVLQVALFPMTDFYAIAPLVLCWAMIGGRRALIGASISWLWWILGKPNDMLIFWLFNGLPLTGISAWFWLQQRRQAARAQRGSI